MKNNVINIVVAGLGGQGVLKASDIIAQAAFAAGYDVKKSEIHGMSQRGGSVSSDVRIARPGHAVLSPMVPAGTADFLLVLSPDQVDNNRAMLAPDGILLDSSVVSPDSLPNARSINVALIGALSTRLDLIDAEVFRQAVRDNLPEKLHDMNMQAFAIGAQAE